MMSNTKRVALAVASIAALAGCGGSEPSSSDVQSAMRRMAEQVVAKAGADSQAEQFAQIKVVKCVKAELGGYACELNTPTGTTSARFKNEGGQWVFAGPA